MVTDPISDFITRIQNAGAVGKETVSIPYSKLKHAVAEVLVKEGYLSSIEKRGRKIKKTLVVGLVYLPISKKHKIQKAERISKLSKRVYFRTKDIRPVKNGKGSLILSTPNGILSGEEARKQKVGGEALFKIW